MKVFILPDKNESMDALRELVKCINETKVAPVSVYVVVDDDNSWKVESRRGVDGVFLRPILVRDLFPLK